MTKNIEEVKDAIRLGEYNVERIIAKYLREGTVIDEDKSVKWNREEVLRLNDEMKKKVTENRKERSKAIHKMNEDIIKAHKASSFFLNEEQMKIIFLRANKESKSAGIWEVIDTFEELIDMVEDIILNKTKH